MKALDAVKRICPKRALLTGMTHDYDHEKINMYLREWSERYKIPPSLIIQILTYWLCSSFFLIIFGGWVSFGG